MDNARACNRMARRRAIKMNCTNCKFLVWADGDIGDPVGFDCLKRNNGELTSVEESALHARLDREMYRQKAKVCFEAK